MLRKRKGKMALLLFACMLAFIENVRRGVKILRALSGHHNLVKFYDACEDANNVYIIMELCEDGDLLDKILSRGGKYSEEDAKVIVRRILSIVAFCPDERLNDIVGSTYYVAPEVLYQSYSMEADVRSGWNLFRNVQVLWLWLLNCNLQLFLFSI